ncbi:FecR domain-containing protein [Xanthomonas sp. XNM01]|uniref:FecR family protein n=1 Tax=Xanthomonas sp. XNM01 TaxID=2769289 RepID=UPI00177EFC75|nr:FecR domain-containing protein [Xanthomonas sp. XNM01]MBD9369872.1 FecR domain-containing protein [Xanthomonas sp. XNM01]
MDSLRIEQAAAAWLARREGDHWNPAQAAALEQWLAADTAHRVAFLRLRATWEQAGRLKALGAGLPRGRVPPRGQWDAAWPALEAASAVDAPGPRARVDAALAGVRFRPREQAPPAVGGRQRFAGIVALAGLFALAIGASRQAEVPPASFHSALGEVVPVTLNDGSDAVLGSDSRIEVRLSPRRRAIALTRGEAIFDVARDPQRPFVVEAGERQVVAVGTRFSVRRDGAQVQVVVTEGTVRLEPVAGGSSLPSALLPAGSVALAGPDGVSVLSPGVEAATRRLAWRDGDLSFEDLPLAEALAEFNRYNPRPLELADPSLATLRVGGSFRWSEPERFVDLVEQLFPVRAERRPDRVLLHRR